MRAIWKAVEMAAKARTEALTDDMYYRNKSDADELTAKHVIKLLTSLLDEKSPEKTGLQG